MDVAVDFEDLFRGFPRLTPPNGPLTLLPQRASTFVPELRFGDFY